MTTEEEKEKSEEMMREWASSITFVDEDGKEVRPAIVPDKMDLEEEESLEPEDQMSDEEYLDSENYEFVALENEDEEIEEEENEEEDENGKE